MTSPSPARSPFPAQPAETGAHFGQATFGGAPTEVASEFKRCTCHEGETRTLYVGATGAYLLRYFTDALTPETQSLEVLEYLRAHPDSTFCTHCGGERRLPAVSR